MKSHFIVFNLVILCLLIPIKVKAQTNRVRNIISATSDIAQPITLKTNLGDYTFIGSITVYGNLTSIEAYDINGNRIVDIAPHKEETVIEDGRPITKKWYLLSSVNYGSSQLSTEGKDGLFHNPYFKSSGVGEPKGFMAKNDSDWWSMTYASLGYGTQYGGAWGANITAKTVGGAFGITGGIGYDSRDLDNKNKPTWYIAGLIGFKAWDLEIGPICRYNPKKAIRDKGLVLMTNLNIPIYGPFGINGGIGFYLPFSEKNPTPYLEWSVGLTIRLHQSI